jgi:hypothetical protein
MQIHYTTSVTGYWNFDVRFEPWKFQRSYQIRWKLRVRQVTFSPLCDFSGQKSVLMVN